MSIKAYTLCVSAEEYERFRTSLATRLYLHRWDGIMLTIETSRPRQLCKDLEGVIDFGATSAAEVFNLKAPP